MMAPSLIVMALVAAFPIGYAIWLSLNEYSVRVEGLSRFVGFDNYSEALWGETSGEFWEAFRITFIFTGISVSIELVLGIAYALATFIFADVWKTAPFMALLLLAGLQLIPEDVYDAAKVDVASAGQRFTR